MILHSPMERLLCRYHDGSLSGWPRRCLEQHLQACGACNRRLRVWEETDARIARVRPVVAGLAPAECDQLFRVALAASTTGVPRNPWLRRWRLAASLALVAGIAGGLMGQHRTTAHGIASAAHGVGSTPEQLRQIGVLATPVQFSSVEVEAHTPNETRRHGRRRVAGRRARVRAPQPPGVSSGMDQLALASELPSSGETWASWMPDEPQLLVVAARVTPPLTIEVNRSFSDQPSFAQVTSTTVTPSGAQVVTQATISSCMPGEPGAETAPQQSSPADEATDQNSMHQKEREKSDGMD